MEEERKEVEEENEEWRRGEGEEKVKKNLEER